jgi:HTH-type transcriptional regulator / antitoxin HigA
LVRDLDVLKNIPYKKMSDNGWIEDERDRSKKVLNLRDFFGVGDLQSVKYSCEVAFRLHNNRSVISDYGVLAWLRQAELEGIKIDIEGLSKTKLKHMIPKFRELTFKDPDEFFPEMQRICAQAGIAFVIVEYIPNTYICGATIRSKGRTIIALSLRGKRADIFWFTFFHELAHILNNSGKETHINYEKDCNEYETDDIAGNYLIPENEYREFLENGQFHDEAEIRKFAQDIGIKPYIVVGRLQHDNIIGHSEFRHLIPSFVIE